MIVLAVGGRDVNENYFYVVRVDHALVEWGELEVDKGIPAHKQRKLSLKRLRGPRAAGGAGKLADSGVEAGCRRLTQCGVSLVSPAGQRAAAVQCMQTRLYAIQRAD